MAAAPALAAGDIYEFARGALCATPRALLTIYFDTSAAVPQFASALAIKVQRGERSRAPRN
jgi:hypothetical protein